VVVEKTKMEEQQLLRDKLTAGGQGNVDVVVQQINHEDEEGGLEQACSQLEQRDFTGVVDLTWGGWTKIQNLSETHGLGYLRVDTSSHQFLQAGDAFLRSRNAVDAALIFASEDALDESLFWIIGNSYLRVVVISPDSTPSKTLDQALEKLGSMRPTPSYYIAHGSTAFLSELYTLARKRKMVRRDSRWNFVTQDWGLNSSFPTLDDDPQVTFLQSLRSSCCRLLQLPSSCQCPEPFQMPTALQNKVAELAGEVLAIAVGELEKGGRATTSINCNRPPPTPSTSSSLAARFEKQISQSVASSPLQFLTSGSLLLFPTTMEVTSRSKRTSVRVGTWDLETGFKSDLELEPVKRFFRVGTVARTPWTMRSEQDPSDASKAHGYCVQLLEEMARRMNFTYKLFIADDFGHKQENGTWTGVVGDLVTGEVDIVVAAMTMTSEREEVIDFVAPYFDQSGISIIIRKPVREQSLFKFMQVLKPQVWVAILGAVIVTALMLWILDRFSPYSARNNKEAYPEPCREFTLKESFWFALTSFTPQGGGEAPKALSARVLVAAYWLFVVLMLATFTANLAAFLTVERMQTTIQNLEELARQSKINYTVLKDSPYMEYFKNMANAEEDLYRVWKDLTLNSSVGDQSKYRVWDYPIKEQYTSIYKVIKKTEMANSSEEGFQRVLDNTEGNFAFIHDASEVKYEFYNNCNLTEVGEPFAEQPYAVAVQQGSHLNEEISRVVLELQKDRYFETLYGRYWNSTLRSECPTLDDSDGITLRSLGGVFIGTLVGLVIAMVALGIEIAYYKKKDNTEVSTGGGSVIHVSAKPRY